VADQVKRVFLDANVLFTAAYNPNGLAAALITRQKKFRIAVTISRYAVEEAEYNLSLKSSESLPRFRELLTQIEVLDAPFPEGFNPLSLPADDAPIFQAALAAGATHLLTGDKKAFGSWMNKPSKTHGIVIQTVRQFFDDFSK